VGDRGAGYDWGWGTQEDDESVAAIQHALELGVNWIDTAAQYGFGHSEEVVGRALAGLRERPYVFTKGGQPEGPGRTTVQSLRRDSLRRELEGSLSRLRVDAVDLYQIHWPIPAEQVEEGWSALAELKEEGLVRHIGVSNFSVAQLRRIQQIAPVETLQPPYSLVAREVEEELLPFAEHERIGVIVYSPMGSGLLTGAMTRERIEQLPEDDWRKYSERFQEPQLSAHLALVDRLKTVAGRHDTTAGAVSRLDCATRRLTAPSSASIALTRSTRSSPQHTWNSATRTPRRSTGGPEMATNTDTTTKIGFVGLGNMGGNMAARLLAAGYPVYGEERSREHAEGLVHEGLQWRDTPREVAEAAGIVFTSVPDDDVLEAVASGPDGILAGLAAEQIWIDMSTVSPRASRASERVSAQGPPCWTRRYRGASPGAIRHAHHHGRRRRTRLRARRAGAPRAGHAHARGENGRASPETRDQHQPGRADARVRRGLLLAERSGIDRKLAIDVMTQSPIGSPMLKARAGLLLVLPDEAWFSIGLMQKDVALALDAARRLPVPLPSAAAADQMLTVARAMGYEERDLAGLFEVLARVSDHEAAA
jgi:aryl-alcohol dehydrogenase-like predicted oxidoreductase/3-hydroxyisobutyrate dehydrogenase-like beta-hydroxyacid dehydrogenase